MFDMPIPSAVKLQFHIRSYTAQVSGLIHQFSVRSIQRILYKRFHGWPRGAGLLQNQIHLEFCFRDGKQQAGITNCQSTDFRKLDFHFNASLAAINLAKAACKRLGITYSISSCKSFIHNAYMLERFICVFGINPDPQVIDKLFKELILFTARAA